MRFGAGDDVKGRGAILQIAPLLLAAVLLEGAGHAASQLRHISSVGAQGRIKSGVALERLASLDLSIQVRTPAVWCVHLRSFDEGFHQRWSHFTTS